MYRMIEPVTGGAATLRVNAGSQGFVPYIFLLPAGTDLVWWYEDVTTPADKGRHVYQVIAETCDGTLYTRYALPHVTTI